MRRPGTSGATVGKRRVEAASTAAREQLEVERANAKALARVKEETVKGRRASRLLHQQQQQHQQKQQRQHHSVQKQQQLQFGALSCVGRFSFTRVGDASLLAGSDEP